MAIHNGANQANPWARGAKGFDFVIAKEVFFGTIAKRVRAVPEELIQDAHFVVDQGVLINVEGVTQLGQRRGEIGLEHA